MSIRQVVARLKTVASDYTDRMKEEIKVLHTGKCPHCNQDVRKKDWPTLIQYQCPNCRLRWSEDK